MKKYLWLLLICVFICFRSNYAMQAFFVKAAKSFFEPPSCPITYGKLMNDSLREHKAVERKTNWWHIPSRSMAIGSLGTVAGYAMGRLLHRPLLISTATGVVATGLAGLFLHKHLGSHPEIQKRKTVQDCLSSIKPLDQAGSLVLMRKPLRFHLNEYLTENTVISSTEKAKLEEKVAALEKVLIQEKNDYKQQNSKLLCTDRAKAKRIDVKTLVGHVMPITRLAVKDDILVSVSNDATAKIWDLKASVCLRTLAKHEDIITGLALVDNKIVTGSLDKKARIWDLKTGKCLHVLSGHEGSINGLIVTDGKIITRSWDRTMRVWDLGTGECLHVLSGHEDRINGLLVIGSTLVSRSLDKTIRTWDLKTGNCLRIIADEKGITSMEQTNGKLVTGSADQTVKMWDLKTGICLCAFSGHEEAISCLKVIDSELITGSFDGTVKIWDLKTGACLHTLDNTGVVIVFALLGRKLITGSADGTVKVWSLKTGAHLYTLADRRGSVYDLLSADNKIISGFTDCTIKVWTVIDPEKQILALATAMHHRCGSKSAAHALSSFNINHIHSFIEQSDC